MKWLLVRALMAAPLVTSGVFAQSDYPNKPVRMVVGFAAGGISDVLGRAVAITLSKQLGQQVIVENKPGAGTTIAGDFTARSAPDGYNLWLQDITSHAINAALYQKLPYDSTKDFTFIAMVASTPLMLVVHPETPISSMSSASWMEPSGPTQPSDRFSRSMAPPETTRCRAHGAPTRSMAWVETTRFMAADATTLWTVALAPTRCSEGPETTPTS